MATFQERKDGSGRLRYRALVRIKVNGKTVNKTRTFDTLTEAEAWALTAESHIKSMQEIGEVSVRSVLMPRMSYSSPRMTRIYRALADSSLGQKAPEKINQADITFYLINRAAEGATEEEVHDETEALEAVLSDLGDGKFDDTGSKSINQALSLAKKAGIQFNTPAPKSVYEEKNSSVSD